MFKGTKLFMLEGLVDGDIVVVQYVGSDVALQNKQWDCGLSIVGCGSWLEFNGGLHNIPSELADKVVTNISMEEGCKHSSNTMFNLSEQVTRFNGSEGQFKVKSCLVLLEGEHYQHITQGDSLQNDRIVVTVTD